MHRETSSKKSKRSSLSPPRTRNSKRTLYESHQTSKSLAKKLAKDKYKRGSPHNAVRKKDYLTKQERVKYNYIKDTQKKITEVIHGFFEKNYFKHELDAIPLESLTKKLITITNKKRAELQRTKSLHSRFRRNYILQALKENLPETHNFVTPYIDYNKN